MGGGEWEKWKSVKGEGDCCHYEKSWVWPSIGSGTLASLPIGLGTAVVPGVDVVLPASWLTSQLALMTAGPFLPGLSWVVGAAPTWGKHTSAESLRKQSAGDDPSSDSLPECMLLGTGKDITIMNSDIIALSQSRVLKWNKWPHVRGPWKPWNQGNSLVLSFQLRVETLTNSLF